MGQVISSQNLVYMQSVINSYKIIGKSSGVDPKLKL